MKLPKIPFIRSLIGLAIIASSHAQVVDPSASYNQIESIGTQNIPLDFVWSPLGQRADNSRWSDDGAVIYADANGILLWQRQNGQVTPIPNSSKAVPLIVSNNKVMVWQNAFNNPSDVSPGDGNGVSPLEIRIYTMNPNTGVISAPVVVSDGNTQRMLGSNIMATAPITTTSVAYHLITSESDGGSPYRIYRVTLSGDVQAVSTINEGSAGDRETARVYGHGTDGTTVFQTLDQAAPPSGRQQDAYWVDGARSASTTGIWEEIASSDAENGDLGSRVFYTSANRVVYEWIRGDTTSVISTGPTVTASRNGLTTRIFWNGKGLEVGDTVLLSTFQSKSDPQVVELNGSYVVVGAGSNYFEVSHAAGTGTQEEYTNGAVLRVGGEEYRIIDARRNPFTGFSSEDDQARDNDITPVAQNSDLGYFRMLQLSTQTVAGDTRWLYALNFAQNRILAYRLNNLGLQLVYSAVLPNNTQLDEWATVEKINPEDGSAIITSDNIDNVIWIGNIGTDLQNATLFPSSSRAKGMFVTSTQALVWNNANAPAGPGGVIPDARIIHYHRSAGSLVASDVSSSISGKTVLTTPMFSGAPNTWVFKTLEKTGNLTTTLRTYGLSTMANRDRDNDGIPDALETQASTSTLSRDTDGDSLSDGDEIYPYHIINGNFTWDQAQADARLKGGRVAVIKNRDDYSAMVRRFKSVQFNSLWLGGTDRAVEGTWVWGDGSPLTNSAWQQQGQINWAGYHAQVITTVAPWAPGRPDNANNADGLVLRSDMLFEDRPLTEERGYVLEYIRSNPLLADTDGDGRNDSQERTNGSDPTVRDSFVGVPGLPLPGGAVPFNDVAVATTYHGLVYDPDQGSVGSITMKVGTNGSFTYRYQGLVNNIAASDRGIFAGNGSFSGDGFGNFEDVTSIKMQFANESPNTWVIYGVIARSSGGQLGFELRRPGYGRAKPYLTSGAVTMAFAQAEVTPTAPFGDGVATGTISRNGDLSLQVYLPNGGSASFKGPILESDVVAMNAVSTKGGQAVLIGALNMASTRGSLDYDGVVRLFSQASAANGSQFVSGIDQRRTVLGSRYAPPARGFFPVRDIISGGDFNTRYNLVEGGFDGVTKIGTWNATNKILIPSSPVDQAQAKFTAKTGLLSYNYTRTNTTSNTTTSVDGFAVALQGPAQIRGYYQNPTTNGKLTVTANDGTIPAITRISPVSKTVSIQSNVYFITVDTPGAWQVIAPNSDWVAAQIVEGGTGALSGSGPGSVRITVQPNATGLWRYATFKIAGIRHDLTQEVGARR